MSALQIIEQASWAAALAFACALLFAFILGFLIGAWLGTPQGYGDQGRIDNMGDLRRISRAARNRD